MSDTPPQPDAADYRPRWLSWAQRLQALAQSGLEYTKNEFDIERYHALRQVAAEMMAAHSAVEPRAAEWLTEFERGAGYATPKVDVRGGVFRDGGVLLVKERLDGRWSLPGGYADVGDGPGEAVEREIREESGYEARAVKLAAVLDRGHHPYPPFQYAVYKLFFVCHLTGGAAHTSIETEGVGFFPLDALPELSVGRVLPEDISRLERHARDLSLPTEYD